LKKRLQDYIFLFLVAGFIVILDQLSKAWIRQNLSIGEIYRPDLWITSYARILFWKNTGAAFGIFQNFGLVFTVLSFVVSAVIIGYFPQISRKDWIIRLAMALLLAGAVGNLLDRLTVGYVTDFISVGNFPVFNFADSSITVGVVVLFVGMWIEEHRKDPDRTPDEQEPDEGSQNQGNSTVTEEMRGE
jgi:signal peptidase II